MACVDNNKHHRVADMTHPVARQRPALRHDRGATVATWANARQRHDAARIEIGSGKDAAHPGHCAGGRGIDAVDRSTPVRRAQHDAVQLIRQVYVIDETLLPVRNLGSS